MWYRKNKFTSALEISNSSVLAIKEMTKLNEKVENNKNIAS